MFQFDVQSFAGRADRIVDFEQGYDRIGLEGAAFRGINVPSGHMHDRQFALAGGALTGHEKVIYDPLTGILTNKYGYDFARVTPGTTLGHLDFFFYHDLTP